ncbi:MAG TPA: hypothetical protein P5077_02795 [bacterium]|nr:hypothetical protein [bacterium]
MKLFQVFFLSVLGIFVSSCGTTYFVKYETKTIPRLQEDPAFRVEARATYNGIVFRVTNNTDSSGQLEWNSAYFVDPSGNSTKALNVDMLSEHWSVLQNENYASIIPPHKQLLRFTTSSHNIREYEKTDVVAIQFSLFDRIYDMTYVSQERFLKIHPYWNPSFDATKKELEKRKTEIVSGLSKENNMGFGFVIKQGEKNIELSYDVKVVKVCLWGWKREPKSLADSNSPYNSRQTTIYETKFKEISCAEEKDNWQWK